MIGRFFLLFCLGFSLSLAASDGLGFPTRDVSDLFLDYRDEAALCSFRIGFLCFPGLFSMALLLVALCLAMALALHWNFARQDDRTKNEEEKKKSRDSSQFVFSGLDFFNDHFHSRLLPIVLFCLIALIAFQATFGQLFSLNLNNAEKQTAEEMVIFSSNQLNSIRVVTMAVGPDDSGWRFSSPPPFAVRVQSAQQLAISGCDCSIEGPSCALPNYPGISISFDSFPSDSRGIILAQPILLNDQRCDSTASGNFPPLRLNFQPRCRCATVENVQAPDFQFTLLFHIINSSSVSSENLGSRQAEFGPLPPLKLRKPPPLQLIKEELKRKISQSPILNPLFPSNFSSPPSPVQFQFSSFPAFLTQRPRPSGLEETTEALDSSSSSSVSYYENPQIPSEFNVSISLSQFDSLSDFSSSVPLGNLPVRLFLIPMIPLNFPAIQSAMNSINLTAVLEDFHSLLFDLKTNSLHPLPSPQAFQSSLEFFLAPLWSAQRNETIGFSQLISDFFQQISWNTGESSNSFASTTALLTLLLDYTIFSNPGTMESLGSSGPSSFSSLFSSSFSRFEWIFNFVNSNPQLIAQYFNTIDDSSAAASSSILSSYSVKFPSFSALATKQLIAITDDNGIAVFPELSIDSASSGLFLFLAQTIVSGQPRFSVSEPVYIRNLLGSIELSDVFQWSEENISKLIEEGGPAQAEEFPVIELSGAEDRSAGFVMKFRSFNGSLMNFIDSSMVFESEPDDPFSPSLTLLSPGQARPFESRCSFRCFPASDSSFARIKPISPTFYWLDYPHTVVVQFHLSAFPFSAAQSGLYKILWQCDGVTGSKLAAPNNSSLSNNTQSDPLSPQYPIFSLSTSSPSSVYDNIFTFFGNPLWMILVFLFTLFLPLFYYNGAAHWMKFYSEYRSIIKQEGSNKMDDKKPSQSDVNDGSSSIPARFLSFHSLLCDYQGSALSMLIITIVFSSIYYCSLVDPSYPYFIDIPFRWFLWTGASKSKGILELLSEGLNFQSYPDQSKWTFQSNPDDSANPSGLIPPLDPRYSLNSGFSYYLIPIVLCLVWLFLSIIRRWLYYQSISFALLWQNPSKSSSGDPLACRFLHSSFLFIHGRYWFPIIFHSLIDIPIVVWAFIFSSNSSNPSGIFTDSSHVASDRFLSFLCFALFSTLWMIFHCALARYFQSFPLNQNRGFSSSSSSSLPNFLHFCSSWIFYPLMILFNCLYFVWIFSYSTDDQPFIPFVYSSSYGSSMIQFTLIWLLLSFLSFPINSPSIASSMNSPSHSRVSSSYSSKGFQTFLSLVYSYFLLIFLCYSSTEIIDFPYFSLLFSLLFYFFMFIRSSTMAELKEIQLNYANFRVSQCESSPHIHLTEPLLILSEARENEEDDEKANEDRLSQSSSMIHSSLSRQDVWLWDSAILMILLITPLLPLIDPIIQWAVFFPIFILALIFAVRDKFLVASALAFSVLRANCFINARALIIVASGVWKLNFRSGLQAFIQKTRLAITAPTRRAAFQMFSCLIVFIIYCIFSDSFSLPYRILLTVVFLLKFSLFNIGCRPWLSLKIREEIQQKQSDHRENSAVNIEMSQPSVDLRWSRFSSFIIFPPCDSSSSPLFPDPAQRLWRAEQSLEHSNKNEENQSAIQNLPDETSRIHRFQTFLVRMFRYMFSFFTRCFLSVSQLPVRYLNALFMGLVLNYLAFVTILALNDWLFSWLENAQQHEALLQMAQRYGFSIGEQSLTPAVVMESSAPPSSSSVLTRDVPIDPLYSPAFLSPLGFLYRIAGLLLYSDQQFGGFTIFPLSQFLDSLHSGLFSCALICLFIAFLKFLFGVYHFCSVFQQIQRGEHRKQMNLNWNVRTLGKLHQFQGREYEDQHEEKNVVNAVVMEDGSNERSAKFPSSLPRKDEKTGNSDEIKEEKQSESDTKKSSSPERESDSLKAQLLDQPKNSSSEAFNGASGILPKAQTFPSRSLMLNPPTFAFRFIGFYLAFSLLSFILLFFFLSFFTVLILLFSAIPALSRQFLLYSFSLFQVYLPIFLLVSLLRFIITKVFSHPQYPQSFIRFHRSFTYVDYFNVFVYLVTGSVVVLIRLALLPAFFILFLITSNGIVKSSSDWLNRINSSSSSSSWSSLFDPLDSSLLSLVWNFHQRQNPWLLLFLTKINQRIRKAENSGAFSPRKHQQARIRWRLSLLLLSHPSLIAYRKQNLNS